MRTDTDPRHGLSERPYRPRLLALANQLVRGLGAFGIGPSGAWAGRLTVGDLIDAARRRTGLYDFGDGSFSEPLERLVQAIETEARLHPVGRLITRARLVGALATRLRVRAFLRRHPEVLKSALPPPIVIAGLQRTGTTLLHRLLASDPALRALLSWEAIAPVGPEALGPAGSHGLGANLGARLRGRSSGEDPRIRQARLSVRALAYMAPGFFAIHPVEPEAPEEDVLLLDYSFRSTVPEATLHVPSYGRWLETQDHTPAYEYMATFLRVLAAQRGPRRWILKTPHHLEYLDVLREVFPGVRIIQTHRDPVRTLASLCSMITQGRGVFSDEVDPHEVGREWSRKVGRMLERSLAVRAAVNDEGFIDVSYYDLVRDPVGEVRRLYEQLGLAWSPAALARLEATRRDNPQHKYGRHAYRLEDFGLSEQGVEPLLAAYRARFAVPPEA
jgi:hypothetical protein